MKFTLGLPTDRVRLTAEFGTAAAIVELARAAEAAGFDACSVTDHPFPPAAFIEAGGHHALDPLVTLAMVAAATERIRLHTNIYVAAYRNPLLSAKAIATLDALSGGRVILGVAAGYLKAEFEALGVPFEGRGKLLDETLEAMKSVWRGEPCGPDGNVMLPLPASPPPVWVGGNSEAAMRRVVRHGDGWLPFPAGERTARATGTDAIPDLATLAARIDRLRSMMAAAGRGVPEVCTTPFGQQFHDRSLDLDAFAGEVADLEAAGVTWVTVFLPACDRAEWTDRAAEFGRRVIAPAVRTA